MESFKTFAISASGMSAQQARLEAAALNLANMNTSIAPGTAGFQPLKAVIHAARPSFAGVLDRSGPALLPKAELLPQGGVTIRTAYEPGHPDADAEGLVSYPAVDHTQEMITVMAALRAYEANLAALETTRTMALKALDIGSP